MLWCPRSCDAVVASCDSVMTTAIAICCYVGLKWCHGGNHQLHLLLWQPPSEAMLASCDAMVTSWDAMAATTNSIWPLQLRLMLWQPPTPSDATAATTTSLCLMLCVSPETGFDSICVMAELEYQEPHLMLCWPPLISCLLLWWRRVVALCDTMVHSCDRPPQSPCLHHHISPCSPNQQPYETHHHSHEKWVLWVRLIFANIIVLDISNRIMQKLAWLNIPKRIWKHHLSCRWSI